MYSQLEGQKSQVVNTAWAILALISAGYHHRDTKQIQNAVRCLLRQQLPSGDWPQEHITGVFNRNCMITYANYRCAYCPHSSFHWLHGNMFRRDMLAEKADALHG